MDHFTKWPGAISLTEQAVLSTAWEYIKIFATHGVYNALYTDQANNIIPNLIREVW